MSEASHNRCLACGGGSVFTTRVGANGGHGPVLLRGLGRFLQPAKMDVYVCEDCGHIAFFAGAEERRRLRESSKWRPVS